MSHALWTDTGDVDVYSSDPIAILWRGSNYLWYWRVAHGKSNCSYIAFGKSRSKPYAKRAAAKALKKSYPSNG